MYSLTINSQANPHFYTRPNVKKIWRINNGSFKFTHRSKIYEPAIECFNGSKIYSNGDTQYIFNCTEDFFETVVDFDRHSIKDFPAVVYKNGTKEWYENGELHREVFPAVVYSNGDEEYWRYGRRHRMYGPAVIIGEKEYWFESGEFIKCIV